MMFVYQSRWRDLAVQLLGCVVAVVAGVPSNASAQVPASSTFHWEVSTDGISWTSSDVAVPISQHSLQIRARVEFDPPQSQDFTTCFGQTFFDATVTGIGGAGAFDSVDSFVRPGWSWCRFASVSTRFGNMIKIDEPGDTLLPGGGTGWLRPCQLNFSVGIEENWENPITAFSYRLNFDGTPGVRDISARLGWNNTSVPPNHFVSVWSRAAGGQSRGYILPTTLAPPLRITVLCPADVDDGTGTGTPDLGVTIDGLLYYLTLYADASPRADLDNGTTTGTPDGGVTTDDLLYYLVRYELGC